MPVTKETVLWVSRSGRQDTNDVRGEGDQSRGETSLVDGWPPITFGCELALFEHSSHAQVRRSDLAFLLAISLIPLRALFALALSGLRCSTPYGPSAMVPSHALLSLSSSFCSALFLSFLASL